MNFDRCLDGVPYVPMIYYHPYQFSSAPYPQYTYSYQGFYGVPTTRFNHDTVGLLENTQKSEPFVQTSFMLASQTTSKLKHDQAVKSQNPQRNVLTNISSQLFTFLLDRRKCLIILKAIEPTIDMDTEDEFFQFVRSSRSKFTGYYNYKKLKLLWFGNGQPDSNQLNYRLIRTLSNYYIRNRLLSALMTSKKISKNLKASHFKARRRLLKLLRDGKCD